MKALKISGIIIAALIIIVLLIILIYALIQPILYKDFHSKAQVEFSTPGVSDGMVQQGFCYVESEGVFLNCGYMADGKSPSRIYITDGSGTGRYAELYSADGSPYLGHTGGITSDGNSVWIANDGEGEDNRVWCIPLADVLFGERITLSASFKSESRAAYCAVDGELLWVGEFSLEGKYDTEAAHHLTSPAGDEHKAFVCAYRISEDSAAGVTETPVMILSVTDRVQGIAFTSDGQIALSTSYAFSNSRIYFYSNPIYDGVPHAYAELGGEQVPVYFHDGKNLRNELTLPPMSEEIAEKDGRLFVQFESASSKYKFGILCGGGNIYSLPTR